MSRALGRTKSPPALRVFAIPAGGLGGADQNPSHRGALRRAMALRVDPGGHRNQVRAITLDAELNPVGEPFDISTRAPDTNARSAYPRHLRQGRGALADLVAKRLTIFELWVPVSRAPSCADRALCDVTNPLLQYRSMFFGITTTTTTTSPSGLAGSSALLGRRSMTDLHTPPGYGRGVVSSSSTLLRFGPTQRSSATWFSPNASLPSSLSSAP